MYTQPKKKLTKNGFNKAISFFIFLYSYTKYNVINDNGKVYEFDAKYPTEPIVDMHINELSNEDVFTSRLSFPYIETDNAMFNKNSSGVIPLT